MEKEMKIEEVMGLGAYLMNTENIFGEMKLNAKAIYNTLKLRKTIIDKFIVAQETLTLLGKNHGAVHTEDGKNMQVPKENLEDFNKEYVELMKESVIISYSVLEIPAEIKCEVNFMEAFFDFISITE